MIPLVLKLLIALVVLLYPIAVYFGLQYLEPRQMALMLAALVLLRAFFARSKLLQAFQGLGVIILLAGLAIAAFSFLHNSTLALKLYPVVISSSFLLVFGYSLFHPPSIIERFARLQEPNLSAKGVNYTTRVTKIWCGFFVLNILVSLYTVFFASLQTWTLYNGMISYLLVGTLFLGELSYRKFILKVE